MRHVVHWNVRNRFVVAFILVAVVPLVVFGALVYSRTAKALREVEQDRITAQTTGAREVLRQRVADERAYIRDYSVWDEFHTRHRTRTAGSGSATTSPTGCRPTARPTW